MKGRTFWVTLPSSRLLEFAGLAPGSDTRACCWREENICHAVAQGFTATVL